MLNFTRFKSVSTLGFFLTGAVLLQSAPSLAQELASSPELDAFFQTVENLDLTSPSIELKSNKGGTSAYGVLVINGKPWGAILPENSATVIQGEDFSFQIGRLLGHPELEGPAKLYSLSGASLARFKKFLQNESYAGEKEKNRQTVLSRIEKSNGSLATVVKVWGDKPFDYDDACKGNRLNMNDVIARFLSQSNSQPSDKIVSLKGVPGSARESDLARQLSTIMVIDALSGQWDRFSGGNLQAISKVGVTQFIALDNGGTFSGDGWLKNYTSFLTRFDREVADRLAELNDFLTGKSTSFQGFTSEADLQRAMSMNGAPKNWALFKGKLTGLVSHIRGLSGDKYFH